MGLLLLLGLCMAANTAAASCSDLAVTHAWVRGAPAAPVMAAYFTLYNAGDTKVSVNAVTSPQFQAASMHKSVNKDGMDSMKPMQSLVVQPAEKVDFAPGGRHIMLFDPDESLQPGDKVTLSLQCNDGQTHTFTAVIKGLSTTGDSMHAMHMQHVQ